MKSGDIYIKKIDNVLMIEVGIFGLEDSDGHIPITFLTVHALTGGVESLQTSVQTREYQDEYFSNGEVIANVNDWFLDMKKLEQEMIGK